MVDYCLTNSAQAFSDSLTDDQEHKYIINIESNKEIIVRHQPKIGDMPMQVWFGEIANSSGRRTVNLKFEAKGKNMPSEDCAQNYAYILDKVSQEYPELDAPNIDPFDYGQSRQDKSYTGIGFIVSVRPKDNLMGVISEYKMDDGTLLQVNGRWVNMDYGSCTIAVNLKRDV